MSSSSKYVEPLSSILGSISDLQVPHSIDTSPISQLQWQAVVGSKIAARTQPYKLDRGVLHVRTASSAWAQELTFLTDEIVAKLTKIGLPIRSLRFHVGTVNITERITTRDIRRTAPPPAPVPEIVQQKLNNVEDDDLREAIQRAVSANLGWQKQRGS